MDKLCIKTIKLENINEDHLQYSDIIIFDAIGNSDEIIKKYNFINKSKIYRINNKNRFKKEKKFKGKEILFIFNIDNDTTYFKYKQIIILLKSIIHKDIEKMYFYTVNKLNNDIYHEFTECLEALTYFEIKEQYTYIYETVCKELDDKFKKCNICDFKNDQCIANREKKSAHKTMGCCYSFNYSKKLLKIFENEQLCKYQKNNECEINCITCKLFTCKYLRSKGICFDVNKILLIDAFLNKKQKEIITTNFFTPEEKIIDKLITDRKNKEPYFWYYFKNKSIINKA